MTTGMATSLTAGLATAGTGWGAPAGGFAVALIAAFVAAAYGASTGVAIRAALAAGRHRRYDDEWSRPLPSYRLLPWLVAAAAALLAWRLAPAGLLPAAAFVLATPLYGALAAVDADVHRLPDALTLPAYPLVAALLGAAAIAPGGGSALRAAEAGLATWTAFALLHVLSRGQLGRGDVKLAGTLGAMLGWLSWEHLLVGVYAMFLVGGLAASWLLLRRHARRTSRLAFGPAMVVGALAAAMLGLPLPA